MEPVVNTPQFSYSITSTDNKENDFLLSATNKNRIGDIKTWLRTNKKLIDFSSKEGVTPLMIASLKGSPKVFELILNNSSLENIRKVDSAGRNALHYACTSADFQKVKCLFAENKLEILKDSYGYCAAEYASPSCENIHNLLGDATRKYLENEGIMLKKIFDEAHGDINKMNVISAKYGLGKFIISTLDDFQNRYGNQICKLPTESKEEFKKERKTTLNREIQAKIVTHFIAFPPESVEKAIGYVWLKYGLKATSESMQALMDYANKKALEAAKNKEGS